MYHYLDVKIIANQDVYSNILQIKTPSLGRASEEGGESSRTNFAVTDRSAKKRREKGIRLLNKFIVF